MIYETLEEDTVSINMIKNGSKRSALKILTSIIIKERNNSNIWKMIEMRS